MYCVTNTIRRRLTPNDLIAERTKGEKIMPLLERGYRAAASADLERSIRKLKERNSVAQGKSAFDKGVEEVQNNLNFAERVKLITAMEAQTYRQRLLHLQREFERIQEAEMRDNSADGIESSHERAARHRRMDDYNSRILRDRERAEGRSDGERQAMPKEAEKQKR